MVAVIVLNWNGGDDTLRCLESLAASTLPHRVYLADNGSTDGSLAKIRAAFPSITIVENGTNLGYAGGNNRAAERATRDGATWLFFLNNDATIAPETLAQLQHAAEQDKSIILLSPRIEYSQSDEKPWFCGGEVSLYEFVVARHTAKTPPDFCSGCALLIRASDFAQVGGFDEAFFAYYEDVDLSLKFRGRCALVADAVVWHRGSASTGGKESPVSLFYTFRNSRALARRHATPEEWARYERSWLREGLWLASFVGGRRVRCGAAALLGMLCARLGQSGKMPRFPLWLLYPIAWLNQQLPRRSRMSL